MGFVIKYQYKCDFWHDIDIPVSYESKEKLIIDFKKVWENSSKTVFKFKGIDFVKLSKFEGYEIITTTEWFDKYY